MMSGPCTSSDWKAWRRASTGGTPSATSRRASCSCSSRQASGPIWSITSLSSANESRAWSTASLIRCPSARTRYQRDVVSTSQSTPFSSSPCSSGSIWPSSASMSAHRSIEPVTSRAIRNAFTTSAGLAPVSVTIRETNVIPCALTTSFDGDRGDELALQRMVLDQVAEPLHDRRREVGLQILEQVGRVGELRVQQRRGDRALRVREQHREFGTHQPIARPPPLSHGARGTAGTRPRAPARPRPRAAASAPRSSRSAGR